MKLILASALLLSIAACAPQISPERAAAKAEQDRLNHEQYLQEKYDDEEYYRLFGEGWEIYNEKGELIDVN